jgi:hypothetical protein
MEATAYNFDQKGARQHDTSIYEHCLVGCAAVEVVSHSREQYAVIRCRSCRSPETKEGMPRDYHWRLTMGSAAPAAGMGQSVERPRRPLQHLVRWRLRKPLSCSPGDDWDTAGLCGNQDATRALGQPYHFAHHGFAHCAITIVCPEVVQSPRCLRRYWPRFRKELTERSSPIMFCIWILTELPRSLKILQACLGNNPQRVPDWSKPEG